MKKSALKLCISLLFLSSYVFTQNRIQSASGNTGTSATTSFSVTLTTAPVNGNTLIAVVATRNTATNTILSITQDGATWTRATSSTGNTTNGTTTEIWYTTSLSGGGTAITINQNSTRSAAVIMEYSGLLYASPIDKTASNYNTSTSSAVTTGTTTTTSVPNELWIGGMSLRSSNFTLSSITNSFAEIANEATTNSIASNNAKLYALEKIVAATGVANVGATVSSKSYWSGAIATFKRLVTGFAPIAACADSGTDVVISGSNLTGTTSVKFNGTPASFTVNNATQITATFPPTATTGYIEVTTTSGVNKTTTPFMVKSPTKPTASITNTSCTNSSDGAVTATNIPVAVNFDVTKSQHINLGSTLLNNLSGFTLEGWVKSSTYNRNSFFGQNNAVEIGLTSSGTIELWSESLQFNVYSPNVYPTDGGWHHIAGTGDGNTMRIYLDGVLIASELHPATSNYGASANNAAIGGYVWDATTPNYHTGQVLKVGFWNKALTNEEIAVLASCPTDYTTSNNGLIAGYNFYEGSGTTLSRIPTGTTGTLTNGAGGSVSTWSNIYGYSWTKASSSYNASTKDISTLTTGTYQLITSFNGCKSPQASFVVNATNIESTAPASIIGDTPICSGSSSTLSVSGGSLGSNALWKWYSGSCGGTPIGTGSTIVVSPGSTTTYFVRAEGTCNTTACVSFTVTVNATGQWIGVTNTDWNTASNWCGGIPTSTTDVIIPSNVPYQPTIGAAGGVCRSLTINTGATVTISGSNTLTVHGNWINNGTFTANTSTVIFNGTSSFSGNSENTFHNITINSTKSLIAPVGNLYLKGNWTNNGSFTANNGTVNFNGTSAQSITGVSTFHNLTINNSAGVLGASNFTVNGVLNLQSESPNETKGSIEMTINYGDYSEILTPVDSLTTRTAKYWDILNSNILFMGANATTTGVGDVTGKVKRTTIAENIDYSFGNKATTIRFNKNTTGTLPAEILFVITKGSVRGLHSNKTNTVQRLYQVIRTGGDLPTSFTLQLHYKDSELNNNSEDNMVLWDHHIPYNTTNTPHEHGKTTQNTSENWVSLSGHGINYIVHEEEVGAYAKYWMFGNTLITGNKWLGASPGHYSQWNNASNWTKGNIPTCSDNVIIPQTTYPPTLPEGTETDPAATAKSVEIETNAVLNGSNGQITVCGGIATNGGKSSWTNNGVFNEGTSTVTFNYPRTTNAETSTISGNSNFYNMTVAGSTYLVLQQFSKTSISGTFTQNGYLDATTYENTFEYKKSGNQSVVSPNNPISGYYNLILSGSGTKSLPAASLTILGNLTTDAAISTSGNTLLMKGNAVQTIGGTTPATFNNLTIDNATGVIITTNEIVNGTLTLKNGLITTGSNNLKITCAGSITQQSSLSYINGKLAREYCSVGSKLYPLGKGGVYRPLALEYTTLTGGTSTVQAEQFESEIAGTIPNHTTYQTDRYWNLNETSGDGNGNYLLTLNGVPFIPNASAKILRGNGTVNSLIAANFITPNFISESVTDNTFGNFAVASECLPPTIDTQPVAATSCELNGVAQFTVSASDILTYQWQQSTSGINGTYYDIMNDGVYSNVTTATLTITNPSYSINGNAYRVIVTRGCGSSAISDGAVLTVFRQPQGSLTANTICKNENGFLTWTATAGSGPYTVVYNDGARDVTVNNVSSGTPFSVGNHAMSKNYTLVSVKDVNCTRTSGFTANSATVEVIPYITWTGETSTDWNTASNWCGGIPTTNDNIHIPSGPANQPLICTTENGFSKSIIIERGASVTVSGENKLDVSGNVTNNGTISLGEGILNIAESTIIENNGLIETKNTSSQPLPNVSTYGNSGTIRFSGNAVQTLFAGTYNDIIIDNPVGITMASNASAVANGKLEVVNGSRLEIGVGRSVAAKEIINNAGTSGIVIRSAFDAPAGTLTFKNVLEKPIDATIEMASKATWDMNQPTNYQYKWQFMGIPVQSLFVLPTFYGAYVRKYNESGKGAGKLETNRWQQLQNGDKMYALNGYEVVQQTAKKYEFPGTLYNQDINLTLSYTPGADYPGQHLIGNPYTTAIDISKIQFGENMEEAVYLYNTGTFASWESYNYGTNSNATQDGTSYTAGQYTAIPKSVAGTGDIPGQIPTMQAFMVRTNTAAEGSIFISYDAVKQKNNSVQRAPKTPLSWMRLNLIGATADHDVMWIFSKDGTTRDYDNGWDGRKLPGDAGTARIQAVEGNSNFQINAVPDVNNTVISARAGKNDTYYKLKISSENMLAHYNSIYLLDLNTNAMIDISQSGTEYLFTMTNTASEPRFKILTSAGLTTENKEINNVLSATYIENKLIVTNSTSNWGEFTVYDVNGTELTKQNYAANQKSVFDVNLQPGVYIYKLINVDQKIVCGKMLVK